MYLSHFSSLSFNFTAELNLLDRLVVTNALRKDQLYYFLNVSGLIINDYSIKIYIYFWQIFYSILTVVSNKNIWLKNDNQITITNTQHLNKYRKNGMRQFVLGSQFSWKGNEFKRHTDLKMQRHTDLKFYL